MLMACYQMYRELEQLIHLQSYCMPHYMAGPADFSDRLYAGSCYFTQHLLTRRTNRNGKVPPKQSPG